MNYRSIHPNLLIAYTETSDMEVKLEQERLEKIQADPKYGLAFGAAGRHEDTFRLLSDRKFNDLKRLFGSGRVGRQNLANFMITYGVTKSNHVESCIGTGSPTRFKFEIRTKQIGTGRSNIGVQVAPDIVDQVDEVIYVEEKFSHLSDEVIRLHHGMDGGIYNFIERSGGCSNTNIEHLENAMLELMERY